MADGLVQVPPDSTGKKIDTSELLVGGVTVERQRVVLADPATAANLATITAAGAVKTDASATTQPVSGTVTANVGSGTRPVSVADGSDTAEGATTDAAVTSDANGTISAKLRGLVKIFADVWDSVNHRIKVDGSGVTQPVSGTVTANQGAAAAAGGGWLMEFDRPTAANLSVASINVAASGDNTIVSGLASKTIRVFKIFWVVTSAVNVKHKDGASTDFHPALPMLASGSFTLDFDGEPWFVTGTGNGFVINLSGAVQISGRVYYTQS